MQASELAIRELANAIVVQAVKDFRSALRGKGYERKSPARCIAELKRFFRSEYFKLLTKVNGDYLIYQLEQEYIEDASKEI